MPGGRKEAKKDGRWGGRQDGVKKKSEEKK